jgi:hypothetical protein
MGGFELNLLIIGEGIESRLILHLIELVPLVGIHSKIQLCSVPYLHMECTVVRMLLWRLNGFEDRIDIL